MKLSYLQLGLWWIFIIPQYIYCQQLERAWALFLYSSQAKDGFILEVDFLKKSKDCHIMTHENDIEFKFQYQ